MDDFNINVKDIKKRIDNEENIVEQDLDVDLLYQSEVMKK